MRTKLYTFSINEDMRLSIAKKYVSSLTPANIREIDVICQEAEYKICEVIDELFAKLDMMNAPCDFVMFQQELKRNGIGGKK